jgi:glycosyltransferase involved in cell wall biosynthesis
VNKVQVFIPNYNGAKYISETIISILNQTYHNFELCIIDNNSIDNSIEIIEKFNDNRIKTYKYFETVSIGENFNRCLKLVNTNYFCIVHSDDIYEPNYISEMIDAFNYSPNSLMAHSNFNCINNTGQVYINDKYELKKQLFTTDRYIVNDPIVELKNLICGNYIICPSMFFKSDILTFIGFFNSSFTFALDWDYSLRILYNRFSIIRVSKILINYRISDINTTIKAVANNIKYEEHLSVILKYKDIVDNNIYKKSRSRLFKIIIWDIKEDLLNKNYDLATNKYLFLQNNQISNQFVLFIIKKIINLKSYGGSLLNFTAKIITNTKFIKI